MAIKEDLRAIKEEIGVEEQFIESLIKGERFFKKYKFIIIGAFVLLVILISGFYINDVLEKRRLDSTNEAYELLLKNPGDKNALELLKNKNKPLYEVFLFKEASKNKDEAQLRNLLNSSLDPFLKDIVKFELNDGNSETFKNIQILLDGYKLLKDGKVAEAKKVFGSIPLNSNLQEIVKKLNHYQGMK
ncbi:MAG: hypothetical protein CR967_04010 [Proteobacteria bacterium]|nr:MAG: hypothetical protein CR967_04010 [Pseudomonadota bacterium]